MDKLLEILKRVNPAVDFANCKSLVDDGILDSIDIVSIVSELEKEYSFEMDPDDIDPDNFQSIETIYEMLNKIIG